MKLMKKEFHINSKDIILSYLGDIISVSVG